MLAPFLRSHDYGALEAELNRRAELKTNDRLERVFRPVAQRDYLALSWQGDTEYELALVAGREADAAKARLESNEGRRRGRGRRTGAPIPDRVIDRICEDAKLAARARFKDVNPTRYNYSAYIFFKTSETPPAALSQIDRDLEAVYRAAPLHHYLLFMRRTEQSSIDKTTEPGPWAPEKPTFATDKELADYLMARVFPAPCPKPAGPRPVKTKRYWPFLSAIGAAVVVAALGLWMWLALARAEGSLAAANPSAQDFAAPTPAAPLDGPSFSPDMRLADIEGGIEDLRAEFTGLRRDVAALTASGATSADFTATARALDSLAERLAVASPAPVSTPLGGGLDRPPCLPVRQVEGRLVPEYLFTAVLSDAGITALPRPGRPDGPDLSPYQARFGALGQTVSAETFRARAAPVVTAEPACRHYVMLVEEEMASAARYAAQRQAVEDHFYIFRLQP